MTFLSELVNSNTPVMTIFTACHLCVLNIRCSLNQPHTHAYTQAQHTHWQWYGRAAFFQPCRVAEKSQITVCPCLSDLIGILRWDGKDTAHRRVRGWGVRKHTHPVRLSRNSTNKHVTDDLLQTFELRACKRDEVYTCSVFSALNRFLSKWLPVWDKSKWLSEDGEWLSESVMYGHGLCTSLWRM